MTEQLCKDVASAVTRLVPGLVSNVVTSVRCDGTMLTCHTARADQTFVICPDPSAPRGFISVMDAEGTTRGNSQFQKWSEGKLVKESSVAEMAEELSLAVARRVASYALKELLSEMPGVEAKGENTGYRGPKWAIRDIEFYATPDYTTADGELWNTPQKNWLNRVTVSLVLPVGYQEHVELTPAGIYEGLFKLEQAQQNFSRAMVDTQLYAQYLKEVTEPLGQVGRVEISPAKDFVFCTLPDVNVSLKITLSERPYRYDVHEAGERVKPLTGEQLQVLAKLLAEAVRTPEQLYQWAKGKNADVQEIPKRPEDMAVGVDLV